jgi:oligosaccharyltransferase complex subunit alpha (ribophorin I)
MRRALLGWIAIALLALVCQAKLQPSPQDWRVTSIIRTIELGGSVTVVSDAHTIRAHADTEEPSNDDQVKPYFFAYSQSDASKISVLDVQAKFGVGVTPDQRKLLAVKDEGPLEGGSSQYAEKGNESTLSRPHLYSVRIPAAFMRRAHEKEPIPDVTLSINSLLLHTSEPLPPSVAQTESQYLLWKGDAAPIAIYDIERSRVKVKSSHPRILSYTTTPTLPSDLMTKSGTTITFGPYEKLTSILRGSSEAGAIKAQVHYLHDSPVVSIVEAKRVVTVSHWRNTMSFEDEFWMRNDGAA